MVSEKNDIVRYLAKLNTGTKKQSKELLISLRIITKRRNKILTKLLEQLTQNNSKKMFKILEMYKKSLKDMKDMSSNKKKEVTSALNYDKSPDFTKRSTSEINYESLFFDGSYGL